jgi:5,10-methylenetetrahydromethanopterin reductase
MTVEILMIGHKPAREILKTVRLAEDHGFDTVWIADERFYRDAFSLLSYLATQTRNVRLGPCITDPFIRHPALTTVAMATLDDISEGRAVLGIGAGVSGFAQLGLEARKAPAAMREAIVLFRRLLAGERVDFRGEIISFNDGHLDFTPLKAHIPVHLASNGPLGQRVAGEVADAAIMAGCGSPAEVRAFRTEVTKGAAKAGRDPASVRLTARLNTCISPDGKAARDAVRMSAARYMASGPMKMNTLAEQGLALPAEALAKVTGLPYATDPSPYGVLLPLITDRHVDACTLAGTPEEVAGHVAELRAAGIDSFIIVPYAASGETPADTIRRFARDVWPAASKAA